jgi:hypothetical protein
MSQSKYAVKYVGPYSSGTGSAATIIETANSESEARAKVLKRIACGSTIISVQKK